METCRRWKHAVDPKKYMLSFVPQAILAQCDVDDFHWFSRSDRHLAAIGVPSWIYSKLLICWIICWSKAKSTGNNQVLTPKGNFLQIFCQTHLGFTQISAYLCDLIHSEPALKRYPESSNVGWLPVCEPVRLQGCKSCSAKTIKDLESTLPNGAV